ncbi:AAA family ATPase [Maribellus comscasis]|uniref:AAA family ATPase n=1 Tax=Maribellus comscasis TaxID=2681766 RepID=A0A6I6K0D8_9BACT|nr:sigma 54-interacting transcriptional regulator [Maribellus comscasis]QGY44863.1 AAA family ATPase [Maribellus comscasis]
MESKSQRKTPSLISLKRIFEGTSEFTGQLFFRSLVKSLAEVLQVYGVWVTEYKTEENRLNALAFWLNGKFIEKYEYDVKGTPCEPVLGTKQICHIPNNVIKLYPSDPDLPPLGAVSYMGLALRGEDGRVLGHLALLDQKPMKEIPEVFLIFKIFASRAQAEIRRIHYENLLKQSEAKINRLLNGTMDAILELNSDLVIIQANEAAFKTFEAEEDNFLNKQVSNFLGKDSFQKILNTTPFLTTGNEQPASVWIQGHLKCLKTNGNFFPADATLSRYEYENNIFYALYIRDINEKLQNKKEIRKLTIETFLLKEQFSDQLSNNLVGKSDALKNVFVQINQVAPTDSTVLILGETGTGKELIAKEIHKRSNRRDKTFIAVNCAALPSDLIESELFGHSKGAFTGATENREGRFLLADNGTLFLDEIGELPLALQAKLLRVVQEGEFEPVGSSISRKVDVRIVAATHRNLKDAVKNKIFREDLFYRLNVFPISVPPLRERGVDILLLAETFLKKYCGKYGKSKLHLNNVNRHELLHYSWPGNVRELQNIIERAVITAQSGNLNIILDKNNNSRKTDTKKPDTVVTYDEMKKMEINNLQLALKISSGKVFGANGAAKLLGIPPTTLNSKLAKFGIKPGNNYL